MPLDVLLTQIIPTPFSYSVGEQPLPLLTFFQHLSVIVGNKLRFNSYFVGIINRVALPQSSHPKLCPTPLLEAFFRNCHGCAFETAKCKFTESLFYKKNFQLADYPSQLLTVNLPSLQQRRIFLDMYSLFKLCIARSISLSPRILYSTSGSTRSWEIFGVPFAELDIYFHSSIPKL